MCCPDAVCRYESRHSVFDFEIDRINVTTARGLLVFSLQTLLFAATLMMLMQESTKLILNPLSAYITDINNLRRAAASVLYIGSGMLAFYRETSLDRAMSTVNPIPMLVDISDTRITGLYAEVRCWHSA
jgi:hypothetical protein